MKTKRHIKEATFQKKQLERQARQDEENEAQWAQQNGVLELHNQAMEESKRKVKIQRS